MRTLLLIAVLAAGCGTSPPPAPPPAPTNTPLPPEVAGGPDDALKARKTKPR